MDELLEVSKGWAQIPEFSDLDPDTAPHILDAAGQFVVQTLAPTNAAGDLQGCRYDMGLVHSRDPIVKSLFTEKGFQLVSAALQIWGGYGYLHEYGVEQSLRDSRIAMIYQGTNEIQAIDLLVRKVIADAPANPELAYRIAADYLYPAGLLLLGSVWARAARLAHPRRSESFHCVRFAKSL